MSQDREPGTDVVGLSFPRTQATLRAGDDDRRRVTDWLQAHYVAGRLTQTELEQRVEQALAARTFGELEALTADLPQLQTPLTWPVQDEARRERRGRRQRAARKGFEAHASSYVLVMAALVVIWLLTSPGHYFWPVWPMLGWGIGLASHGLAVRRRGSDGSDGTQMHLAI